MKPIHVAALVTFLACIGLAIAVYGDMVLLYLGLLSLLIFLLMTPAVLLSIRHPFVVSQRLEDRLADGLHWRYYAGALTDVLAWAFTFGAAFWALARRTGILPGTPEQIAQVSSAAIMFPIVSWFIYGKWGNRLIYPNGSHGVPDSARLFQGRRTRPGTIEDNLIQLGVVFVILAAVGEAPLVEGLISLVVIVATTLVPAALAAILFFITHVYTRANLQAASGGD